MDLKQNPFSLYDFLGYFIPGALALLAIFAISQLFLPAHISISQSISNIFQPDKLEFYLPFVLVSYLTGHAISFVSSVTVERYSNWRVGYPSSYLLGNPFPNFFNVSEDKCIRLATRITVAIFIFPISLLDCTVGNLLKFNRHFARPADNVLQNICHKIAKLVWECTGTEVKGEDIISGKSEFFRLMYHYCVEKAKNHLPKMQNYVALYGFCRTISLVFVLISWSLICVSITTANPPFLWMIIAISLAYLFYLDFMKFYRRFSLEVFMAFAVTYNPDQLPAEQPVSANTL